MTTILVEVVEAGCTSGMEHHIKMPRDMAFKKVATLLSNKFKSAKDAQLCLVVSQESGPPERRYIFDSDTPDSVRSLVPRVTHFDAKCLFAQLGLKDRTRLRFEHSRGVESIDMSDM